MKPIKWPLLAAVTDKEGVKFYVDALSRRNYVVDPVTGLSPVQQREAFMKLLLDRGVPFKALPPDQDYVRLSVTIVGDGKVFHFSPNACKYFTTSC